MQVIGMHVGSSFAEVCVMRENEKGQLVLHEGPFHLYLPRQPLKSHLPRLLDGARADAAFSTCQFLERLFDFRLGGSTAQVVTSGCEAWPFLGTYAAQRGWIHPTKTQPIAARELSFPIAERIDANGQVLEALQEDALSLIAIKMKELGVKRVCVHFMNAPKNPLHQNQAVDYLKREGFEVFVPSLRSDLPEIHRWRRSTLEASFSGTFDEIRSEIEKGLEGQLPSSQIFFRDRHLFATGPETSRVGTLFGLDHVLAESFPQFSSILDLGLESWRLITRKQQTSWASPWGPIDAEGVTRLDLRCQPTSLLERSPHGDVAIHPKKEGFEPGPLCFGRGQKLLAFDLFASELQNHPMVKSQISEQGLAKAQSYLQTLCRMGQVRDPAILTQQLKADVLESIAWDIQLHAQEGPLMIHGFFAPLLFDALKERLPGWPLSLHLESSASLVAKIGRGSLP